MRQFMHKFSQPQNTKTLLHCQQNLDETIRIKQDAAGYVFNVYLNYMEMEANGYKNTLSMKIFG